MATWFWTLVVVLGAMLLALVVIAWATLRNSQRETVAEERDKMRAHELALAAMQTEAHARTLNARPKSFLGGFATTPDLVGGSVFHDGEPVEQLWGPWQKAPMTPQHAVAEDIADNEDDGMGATAVDVLRRNLESFNERTGMTAFEFRDGWRNGEIPETSENESLRVEALAVTAAWDALPTSDKFPPLPKPRRPVRDNPQA